MIPTSSYKQTRLLLALLIFFSISFLNGQNKPISITYNKIDLKKAIQQLVDTHQLPLIYPSNIEFKVISTECNNCEIDSALTLLLFNTNYTWKKIDKQYTIYKIETVSFAITGKIFDKLSNETIPYANVFIPSLDMGTISNDEGVFSLSEIVASVCTLNVSYIGYETQKEPIYFSSDQIPNIEIYLEQKIINSKNIFIRGKAREFMSLSNDPGRISFSPKHISTLPTIGEVDIFRSLQLLPGIHQGLGGPAELYIRGGRPDQNLIIIDGMPIYQKTHMFGFLSSIQAEAVKDVQVYKGGYPAQFGGRTSGLIGITNRVGNTVKPRIRLYTNFTINSAQIELPISSRGSFILTARDCNNIVSTKLYKSVKDFITGDDNFNLISVSANETQKTTYNPQFTFQDINAVLSYLISPRNRISLTHTNGADIINEKREFFGFGTILEYDSTSINENTEWSNQGTIINWSYYFNPKWHTKFSIAKTGFTSHYNTKLFDEINDLSDFPEQVTDEKNIFSDKIYSVYQSIKAISSHHIEMGFNRSILSADYETNRTLENNSEQFVLNQKAYLQSIYFQDKWSFSKPIRINIGLRNTYYSKTNKNYIMPRLSLSYKITPAVKLESSYGIYKQFIHQFNSPISTRGTKGTWLISSGIVPVINSTSSHSSLSWQNSYYNASLSYYQRNSSGQYDFQRYISPIAIFSSTNNTEYGLNNDYSGTERTVGSEIFIRRKNKPINGWIAYQFNNTKYSFNDIDEGRFFSADHDVTHEFKSVIITSILDYDFTANWSYSSGRVYTHPEEINKTNDFQIVFNPGARNRERLNPVHHLDISISKKYIVNRYQFDIGLSIYNIYNRRNVSHKRYNPYTAGNIISDVVMLGITPTLFIQASS